MTSRSREGEETRHEADAVVFAIGISGMLAAKYGMAYLLSSIYRMPVNSHNHPHVHKLHINLLCSPGNRTRHIILVTAANVKELFGWLTGMQKLVAATPALAARPEFQRIMNLKGLDVISTRCALLLRAELCSASGRAR